MATIDEREIKGTWEKGYALDIHTLSSMLIGYNAAGYPEFDTKRSEVGELLHRLKYRQDLSAIGPLTQAAMKLLVRWKPRPELIVPVPATRRRKVAPVLLISEALSRRGRVPCIDCVRTTRNVVKAMKNVLDPEEREALLADLYTVDPAATRGKRILLIDDLYRSGATMNAITQTLLQEGEAASVVVLAMTCTRSNA